MDFDKVLKKRRCIRKYSTKKVSMSDLTKVCEAARMAPAAGNIYTVRLVVVSDANKKEQLKEASMEQDFIAKASYIIVVCSDLEQLRRSYGTRAEIYGRQQAGASIENMMLKAADLDLACCWVGAFDENAVKRILNIPEHVQVEALLPLSNPFGKTEAKKKPDLNMIIYFEKWGQRTVKPGRKPYA